jgi:hypothetical protein
VAKYNTPTQGQQNQLPVLPRLSHSLCRQVEILKNYLYKYHKLGNASDKNRQESQNQILLAVPTVSIYIQTRKQ